MSYIKESAQFLDWIEREGQYSNINSTLDFNYSEQQYLQQLIRESSNRGSSEGVITKARISNHPTQDDSKESRRCQEVQPQQA